MADRRIESYDATLRESKQGMGINFGVEALVAIIGLLDRLGVDLIETGWPGANRAWDQLYSAIKEGSLPELKNSKLVAFASTRRAKKTVRDDKLFVKLIEAPVDVLTVFGKSWLAHVSKALRTTPQENLNMVNDSMRAITQSGHRGVFDAEHFFQGFKVDGGTYALEVLSAALEGGADTLVLCDTNGIAYPWEVESIVSQVVEKFGDQAKIGVHLHGDRGLDVANTITALRSGANHFQGTINGYSERVRMACTIEVLANLHLLSQEGHDWASLNPAFNSELLKETSREVDRWAGLHPYQRKPFVGRCCSTHKAGVHVSGGQRAGYELYESHDPHQFGRRRHVVVSGMSGKSNVIAFTKAVWDSDVSDNCDFINAVLAEIEGKESQGYSFDSCSGSAALLVGRMLWPKAPNFKPAGYHFHHSPTSLPGELMATITVDSQHPTNKGDGPVDALANAALTFLIPKHSCLKGLGLDDYTPYKLRVPGKEGTASAMRVEIDWVHDQIGSFTTQGVSTNIINASFEAIVEAIELVLIKQWRQEVSTKGADTAEVGQLS